MLYRKASRAAYVLHTQIIIGPPPSGGGDRELEEGGVNVSL